MATQLLKSTPTTAPTLPMFGDTLDARSLALLRCMIAVTVLFTSWSPDTPLDWSLALARGSIALYGIYSFVIAIFSYQADWQRPPRWLCWADVASIAWIVAVTYVSGSSVYQAFFYPIFVASFTLGFREGVFVTFSAFAAYIAIALGFAFAGVNAGPGHSNALIRGDYLLVVGYMIAYCGGYGGLFMRKLALLKEINSFWHARIGVDQVYGSNLDRLIEFFGGSMCILVMEREEEAERYTMYTSYRDKPGHALVQHNVAENAAKALLHSLPATVAAYYHDPEGSLWRKIRGHHTLDTRTGAKSRSYGEACKALANLLDTRVFVTVPYALRGGTTGRIFLTLEHGSFNTADLDFLSQASNAISTVVESMLLVEELINKAAEQERSSISRDLHDTTIQPYIGLKLAIEGLLREATEDSALAARIRELIAMAEMTVEDLRDFAATIKGKSAMPGDAMIAAITTQANRLSRFYGINVSIASDIKSELRGRLAAEVFQIASEGLSNVLRHTKAKNASVSVTCTKTELRLEICNDEADGRDFTPRSIFERVRALNGVTQVEHLPGKTIVAVTIPM